MLIKELLEKLNALSPQEKDSPFRIYTEGDYLMEKSLHDKAGHVLEAAVNAYGDNLCVAEWVNGQNKDQFDCIFIQLDYNNETIDLTD